jgi:hypothetical protein
MIGKKQLRKDEKDGTHSFFTGNIMSGSQLVQFTA